MNRFHIRTAHWPQDADATRALRRQVFVIEQGIDPALEWTNDDDQFRSVLALDVAGHPIGTGRIKVETGTATIGRMAVLHPNRSRGVGGAILSRLIEIGKAEGANKFELSAQVAAINFYQRHGFEAFGDVYLDAGIEHRKMIRTEKRGQAIQPSARPSANRNKTKQA